MYKVFINKLSIILTSKNKSLSQENSFLLILDLLTVRYDLKLIYILRNKENYKEI